MFNRFELEKWLDEKYGDEKLYYDISYDLNEWSIPIKFRWLYEDLDYVDCRKSLKIFDDVGNMVETFRMIRPRNGGTVIYLLI